MMDPLPNLNKAYLIVLRVEKHREVQVNFADITDNAALLVYGRRSKNGNKSGSDVQNLKKQRAKPDMRRQDKYYIALSAILQATQEKLVSS